METQVDWKRILIFCAFAFSIAWVFALVLALTGGLMNSPVLIPDTPITLAMLILPTGVMFAPALAHVLTRLLTKEGWHDVKLRFKLRKEWGYWILAWIGPAVLTILGAILYFLILPRYFDSELTVLRQFLDQQAPGVDLNPWVIAAAQTMQAILLSPVLNGIFTFGEEFGWRAYLLPKLMPLGTRKAFIISGVIWGLWHAPIIAMGHNYGLSYPGAPWLGILVMVWFTLVVGIFISWVTLQAGSVWPAVIAHGALNGIASLAAIFTQGQPNPLLGPLPVGIVAMIPFTLFAIWIFVSVKPQELGSGVPTF